MVVAVKKLNEDGFQGHRQWLVRLFNYPLDMYQLQALSNRNQNGNLKRELLILQAEVDCLGRLHHINLVKLIGYCSKGDFIRLLVYEYMPKGSLENHLFRRKKLVSQVKINEILCKCYIKIQMYTCYCVTDLENLVLDIQIFFILF